MRLEKAFLNLTVAVRTPLADDQTRTALHFSAVSRARDMTCAPSAACTDHLAHVLHKWNTLVITVPAVSKVEDSDQTAASALPLGKPRNRWLYASNVVLAHASARAMRLVSFRRRIAVMTRDRDAALAKRRIHLKGHKKVSV